MPECTPDLQDRIAEALCSDEVWGQSWDGDRYLMELTAAEKIMTLVAPTVRAAKAEALREAADGLLGRNPEESQSGSTTHYAVGCWLSARADRIENGEEQ